MLTVSLQIQEIFQQRVVGRRMALLEIVEELLSVAGQAGQLRCTVAGPDKLRFEIPDQEPLEVPLEDAKGRLRTMCARLAVLCQKSGGEFTPYGGEGIIKKAA